MAMDFTGKRVAVMGLGRFGGGVGVTRWLCGQGADVLVTDLATEAELDTSLAALRGISVRYRLGRHDETDLDACDLLVANPAVDKRNSPYFKAAMQRGVPWSSEMNLFLERCPAKIVGVTGTVGKSTTTAMIGTILEKAKTVPGWRHGRVWLGGNIGKSLLEDLPKMKPDDAVVLELSSFQLEDAEQIRRSPHIALVTNIRENHLDRHGTLKAYAAAKANIYRYQSEQDWLILPVEQGVELLPGDWPNRLRLWRFTVEQSSRRIRWTRPGEAGQTLEEKAACLAVPGLHNVWNAAGAWAAARILGVDDRTVQDALAGFRGLAHRLEFVCEQGGVRYYNDSKATTPDAAMTSLLAFDCPVVVLLGGSDKGSSFAEFGRVVAQRAKAAVCMGATREKIALAIEQSRGGLARPTIERASDFAEAVRLARRLAEPGGVVLLSPACASYDWFRNYEYRGEAFKKLVLG